ncbi:MAG: rhodanese-like domain-containing protein, partial [Desulfobacterales bacterium]
MSKQKMTQYFIIAMTTLLLAVSGRLAAAEVSAAPEASSTPGIPEELIGGSPIETDYSIAVTATELLKKNKQNCRITIVDVRSPEEFERLRIPGSINVPLHAV